MTLKSFIRTKTGKQAKELLKEGFIPAVLYGRGIDNINLSVPLSDFNKIYKEAGESAVIKLEIYPVECSQGEFNRVNPVGERNVLINDVQYNCLSDKIIHIDFYEVKMDEKVEVAVPLVFTGESLLVKSGEAVLVKVLQEVEVEALPAELPQEFEVDVSILDDLEKKIYVRDLQMPPGVVVKSPGENIIAALSAPEEEKIVSVEEAVGKVEEVEVEADEKKKEKEEEE